MFPYQHTIKGNTLKGQLSRSDALFSTFFRPESVYLCSHCQPGYFLFQYSMNLILKQSMVDDLLFG